ncbi:MAG: hypothetical protein FAF05_04490 [Epsilonproteobacteria bacterium]|nr:hypothetical protein [Campylobacterota bacterium]
MWNVKRGLFFGVIFAFLVLGMLAMQRATPPQKEHRIYEALKVYIPYKFEKRIGGLTIVDTRTGEKEKPEAAEVLFRMDELQQKWGHKHLVIQGDQVIVLGENNQTVAKIFIETPKERAWLQTFFGL